MVKKTANKKLIFIDTKEKQLEIKRDFQDLFLSTFKKPISDKQWQHFYLNVPFGQTISFVYYDNDIMVAHGGLIPQRLISKRGEKVEYFLQTAIMVREKYQNLLLFKELMDAIDSYVAGSGSFVVAFPNKNTYLPFVKMLRWKMVLEYDIKQYSLKEGEPGNIQIGSGYDLPYEIDKNETFMRWRSDLNNMQVLKEEDFEMVYKDYDGSLEILDIYLKDQSIRIPTCDVMRKIGYRKVNIAGCFAHQVSFKDLFLVGTVGITQRMCFYPFNHEKYRYEDIKPSLLLSDVF